MTHRTMSEHSYHGATSRSQLLGVRQYFWCTRHNVLPYIKEIVANSYQTMTVTSHLFQGLRAICNHSPINIIRISTFIGAKVKAFVTSANSFCTVQNYAFLNELNHTFYFLHDAFVSLLNRWKSEACTALNSMINNLQIRSLACKSVQSFCLK